MAAAVFSSGIYPIQYALFDEEGRLSRAAMKAQIDACLRIRPAGIATLGLATEVRDLTAAERREVVEWNAEDIAGRTELAVTIFEPTVEAQIEAMRHAAGAGASWAILQPPAEATDPVWLMHAFSRAIDAAPLPVAIQNAPQYIGVGLDTSAISELARRHGNLQAIKQEVPAVETAELVERIGETLFVYSGRGGLELVDCIAAGIRGHVPAPEYADLLKEVWAHAAAGDYDAAFASYRRVLPLATFVMQSLATLLTYGKFLFCARQAIPFFQRNSRLSPTGFGLATLRQHCQGADISVGSKAGAWELPARTAVE